MKVLVFFEIPALFLKFSLNITILERYNQKERIIWQIKSLCALSNTPILDM